MALPQQIQAQVEQADQLLAAMNKPPEGSPEATPQGVDLGQLAQVATEAVPTAQAEKTQEPAPRPVTEETWESKFKSLQGIFNKEVPQLQTRAKALEKQLEQALALAESLKKADPEPEKSPPKPVADPKDVEDFGADLVEMVQRVTQASLGTIARAVDAEFAKISDRLAQLEQQLQGTTEAVAVTAEDKFFEKLAKEVPNWEQINTSQSFIDWLAEVDPVYGIPRQVGLQDARAKLDAQRVINIFRAFAPEAAQQANVPNPIDKQVSPKTGASGGAPQAQSKPILSSKQIKDFYNDVARNVYRGREPEMQAIEAVINQAIAEGRVR